MHSNSLQPDPIHRRKISDEVAERLEAMIFSGRFSEGDQLPSERELMRVFGVGRPAIREGLFSLQKLGLVRVGNGSRAKVTRPTPATFVKSLSGAAKYLLAQPNGISQLQDARLFFEVGLARHAALHATESDLSRLRNALDANLHAIDDPLDFQRTDVAFHYVLAEIAQNSIFTAIHDALVDWLTEQRSIALQHAGANHLAYGAHERIYEAIARRSLDDAEEAMRAHLTEVTRLYWKVWTRSDGGIPSDS